MQPGGPVGSSTTRAERLLKITAAVADAVSSEQVYAALVDHVADALEASTTGLWIADRDGGVARLVRGRGYRAETSAALESVPLDLAPSLPMLDALRSGQTVWLASQTAMLDRYPHLASMVTPDRLYGVVCLPLGDPGRVLGVLGLTIDEERFADASEREILPLVGRYATQAMERLQLIEQERRLRNQAAASVRRLEILSRATRTFNDTHVDLRARLQAVAEALSTALDSCINVALLGDDNRVHLTIVHHPDPEAQRLVLSLMKDNPLAMGEGAAGRVTATGQSILVPAITPEMAAQAPAAYREFLARFPVYALVAAPLVVGGRAIGSVSATRVAPGQTYTTDDLGLLQDLADRAAIAIANSRLYEEALRAHDHAEHRNRFAQTAVAATRIETVYEAALHAVEQLLRTSRSSILLYDPDGVMRFEAWHGLSDRYRRAVEGHSPWSRDAIDPEPVLVTDVRDDPDLAPYLPLFESEGIVGMAFVPIVLGGRLLGKFMVYFDRPRRFDRVEIESALALAKHLSTVIARFSALAELQETVSTNEMFAGILAHDLRGPLGAILNAAELVSRRIERGAPVGPNERRLLDRVLSSGQRMSAMIGELLDFTRARSGGGIGVEPHATDVSGLVRDAVGEIEIANPAWRIDVAIRGDTQGTWDGDRLAQVVANLVRNAGQHGVAGSPIEVGVDGSDAARLRVTVHNGGVIPEDVLPRLFEPFHTASRSTDGPRGLGLGLYIVREIVRAHGGSVGVTSTESGGTTFAIDLPRHAQSRHRERSGQSVLVVDDDHDARSLLTELLVDRGFQVSTARNGREALEQLRGATQLPTAVVLDLVMPVMDGYGFLKERQADPTFASIPVVLTTASMQVAVDQLGSAVSIMPKPVRIEELVATLRRYAGTERSVAP